jgi:hypothetical protein
VFFPRLNDAQLLVRFIHVNDRVTYASPVEEINEKVLEVSGFILIKSGSRKNECHHILTKARGEPVVIVVRNVVLCWCFLSRRLRSAQQHDFGLASLCTYHHIQPLKIFFSIARETQQ